MPSRREFIAAGAAGLAALRRGDVLDAAAAPSSASRRAHPLQILILGGTGFIGPHQIAYALGRGHSVTTFTRGQARPSVHRRLYEEVEALVGDREGDLSALRGRGWDVVIDNSGRREEWTRDSAGLLRDTAGVYVYTSSTGVYYPYLGDAITEGTAPVLEVPADVDEGESVEYGYGVMKARSELAAIAAFGEERTIVVRPTYMMGPADTSNRFPYWPERLARGGTVLVPGKIDDPVQYVDVRDVAAWPIRLAEEGRAGTYNAVGPASRTGMLRFVHGAHAAFGSAAELVVVDDYDFLREHRVPAVVPWIMPVGANYGSARISNRHAMANGLELTPLADSIRDIYEWWHGDGVTEERRQQLAASERSLMVREADILRDWRSRG